MCKTVHYLCACGHYTDIIATINSSKPLSGSKYSPCWKRVFCKNHTDTYENNNSYWRDRCCLLCQCRATPLALKRMKTDVRRAARRLRTDLGLPRSNSLSTCTSDSHSHPNPVSRSESTSKSRPDSKSSASSRGSRSRSQNGSIKVSPGRADFATSGPYRTGYGAGSFSGRLENGKSGRKKQKSVRATATVMRNPPVKVSYTSPGGDSGYSSLLSSAHAKNRSTIGRQTQKGTDWRDALYGENGYLARRCGRDDVVMRWDEFGYIR